MSEQDHQILCKISGRAIYAAVKDALKKDPELSGRIDASLKTHLDKHVDAMVQTAVSWRVTQYNIQEMVRQEVKVFATQGLKDLIREVVNSVLSELYIKEKIDGR